jgi:D-3-phosphoglycerate dehydrogenase / 2-oxoglutarate reductase
MPNTPMESPIVQPEQAATVLVTHPRDRLDSYFGAQALQRLHQVADVRLNGSDRDLQGQALIDAAQGCAVVIAYRQTPVDAQVLAALPQLRAVVRCAVDIRTIDVSAASAQGVLVTQASPGFMAAVSEWIVGVMIDLFRGIGQANREYHSGAMAAPRMGRELRGARLGVVGYGQIGRYLCPVAQALGMQVLVTDPHATADAAGITQLALLDLLAQADVVVCLAPATPQTENMFDARAFAAMRKGAFFINAARGNLVDEAALLQALGSGHLGGAALDVGRAADQMPSPALACHPAVIATPHIGGLTPPAIQHQALETVAQTGEILQGRIPAGAVNAARATRMRTDPRI